MEVKQELLDTKEKLREKTSHVEDLEERIRELEVRQPKRDRRTCVYESTRSFHISRLHMSTTGPSVHVFRYSLGRELCKRVPDFL